VSKDRGVPNDDDLRPDYGLSGLEGGPRGKYADAYRAGTDRVHPEPGVAELFADDESVNQTLRSLLNIANAQVRN